MGKSILTLASIAIAASLASCSVMQQGQGASSPTTTTGQTSGQNLLGNLLSTLVGNAVPMTKESLIGTWSYTSPECRFKSENALMQAGGEIGAGAIEEKLAGIYTMLGITPGSCSFTFNNDNTCNIKLGRIPVSGSYTFNPSTHELSITDATGMFHLNGKVYNTLNGLAILFDADKLLSVAKTVASFTGKGSQTMSTISDLLNSYKDMELGMNLKK